MSTTNQKQTKTKKPVNYPTINSVRVTNTTHYHTMLLEVGAPLNVLQWCKTNQIPTIMLLTRGVVPPSPSLSPSPTTTTTTTTTPPHQ